MPFPFAPRRALRVVLASGAALALLAGCNGGGGSTAGDTVTVQGDVPIAYAKRSTAVRINPTNGAPSAPGGDLMVRATSSPSAQETNLTAGYTQGRGDVVRPEVSYDGKKIVFAMRCPADNTAAVDNGSGPVPACTGRWNIWEYDMSRGGLTGGTLRRLTASNDSDDVDPTYLPAGRGFVFASNRQAKSSRNQALGRAYSALDEYERERVVNLHTMDASGGDIRQITFNQSHDRRPVVRANGDIMFARWEHVANTNRFAIFRAKPDGTDLFVLYGEHSPGNSYLDPRETAATFSEGRRDREAFPLNRLRWGTARDLCRFAGGDLPTEAQWERAASWGADAKRFFPWGDAPVTCETTVAGRDSAEPVCPGRAPLVAVTSDELANDVGALGILGLGGNVSEYVLGSPRRYDDRCFRGASVIDPLCLEPTEGGRVLRGGEWRRPAGSVATVSRLVVTTTSESEAVGFRCAYPERPQ